MNAPSVAPGGKIDEDLNWALTNSLGDFASTVHIFNDGAAPWFQPFAGIPAPFVLLALIVLLIWLPFSRTVTGRAVYAIGSAQLRIPDFLPEDYGINLSLFSDFGTLGHIDDKSQICAGNPICLSEVKDNLAFRASAGLAIGWKSPFGPIEIDLGMPFIKTAYDRPQIIHFSAGTGIQ